MKIAGKTKKRIDKDFVEIIGAQLIATTFGLIGGIFLTSAADKLYLIPGLLVLIPGFLEMHGNILGSLAARLGTALHTRKISPELKNSPFIKENVFATVSLGIIVGLFLGLLAFLITKMVFGVVDVKIIFVAVFALILSLVIELPLTLISTFWFFRKGYDPDDVMGPYVTTSGDVISILSLLVALWVVL